MMHLSQYYLEEYYKASNNILGGSTMMEYYFDKSKEWKTKYESKIDTSKDASKNSVDIGKK